MRHKPVPHKRPQRLRPTIHPSRRPRLRRITHNRHPLRRTPPHHHPPLHRTQLLRLINNHMPIRPPNIPPRPISHTPMLPHLLTPRQPLSIHHIKRRQHLSIRHIIQIRTRRRTQHIQHPLRIRHLTTPPITNPLINPRKPPNKLSQLIHQRRIRRRPQITHLTKQRPLRHLIIITRHPSNHPPIRQQLRQHHPRIQHRPQLINKPHKPHIRNHIIIQLRHITRRQQILTTQRIRPNQPSPLPRQPRRQKIRKQPPNLIMRLPRPARRSPRRPHQPRRHLKTHPINHQHHRLIRNHLIPTHRPRQNRHHLHRPLHLPAHHRLHTHRNHPRKQLTHRRQHHPRLAQLRQHLRNILQKRRIRPQNQHPRPRQKLPPHIQQIRSPMQCHRSLPRPRTTLNHHHPPTLIPNNHILLPLNRRHNRPHTPSPSRPHRPKQRRLTNHPQITNTPHIHTRQHLISHPHHNPTPHPNMPPPLHPHRLRRRRHIKWPSHRRPPIHQQHLTPIINQPNPAHIPTLTPNHIQPAKHQPQLRHPQLIQPLNQPVILHLTLHQRIHIITLQLHRNQPLLRHPHPRIQHPKQPIHKTLLQRHHITHHNHSQKTKNQRPPALAQPKNLTT